MSFSKLSILSAQLYSQNLSSSSAIPTLSDPSVLLISPLKSLAPQRYLLGEDLEPPQPPLEPLSTSAVCVSLVFG